MTLALNRKRMRIAASFGALGILISAGACTADSDSGSGPPAMQSYGSPYSIKVYAQRDSNRTRLDLVPIGAGTAVGADPSAAPAAIPQQGLRAQTGPILNPHTPLLNPNDFISNSNDASNLLRAAAAECGMVGLSSMPTAGVNDGRYDDLQTMFDRHQSVPTQTALVKPWLSKDTTKVPWYIFETAPTKCDHVLEYEETLLCVADKLAQLADSIAPVTWENVRWIQSDATPTNTPEYNWLIPPQGDQDKFIARDLAIHVLGHVPWLDAFQIDNPSDANWPRNAQGNHVTSCSSLYAMYDSAPPATKASLDAKLWSATATNAYPPDPTDLTARGRARLAFATNTLRASGLLLHDITRDSVYSDLAGSEHKRRTASDRTAGGTAAWGSGTDPYNSLTHVARVLAGRWELPPYEDSPFTDTSCMPVDPLNLTSLLDPGTAARIADVGALSTNEAFAGTLFEHAGLVIPPSAPVNLRDALQTQLMGMKDALHGQQPAGTYAATPEGLKLASLIAGLSDAELARGARRVANNFAVASNSSPSTDPLAGLAKTGFHQSLIANSALTGGAIAIQEGLPRTIAAGGDPMTQLAIMNTASQCAYRDQPEGMTPETSRFGLQDTFAIGYEIRSRIVMLREAFDHPATATTKPASDQRARAAAVAELGAWAGHTQLFLAADTNEEIPPRPPTELDLYVYGAAPEDFGVTHLEDLSTAISLVYGDGVDADCATKLRPACGASRSAAEWKATGPATVLYAASDPQLRLIAGSTGALVVIQFKIDGHAPPALQPPANLTAALGTHPFFVVSKNDPAKPAGQGAVLGALRIPVSTDGVFHDTSTIVSPMRVELSNAFGMGKWIGPTPPKVGEYSMSDSPQYCVEGVSRDVFVPLENELTSDSDGYENSWKHYLDLASAAAKRADDLGQTWVDIGFLRDTQAESFEPDLIQKTGSETDLDGIKMDEQGNILAGATNGALATILNQAKIDLVFLSEDPLPIDPNTPDGIKTLRSILPCPDDVNAQRHALCGPLESGATLQRVGRDTIASYKGNTNPKVITFASMGLAPVEKQPDPSMDQCQPMIDLAKQSRGAIPGNFSAPAFSAALSANWASDLQSINAQLHHLRMRVEADGNWSVSVAGAIIMTSQGADPAHVPYWPSCLAPTDPAHQNFAPSCDFKDRVTSTFNSLFRRCAGSDPESSPLGACEGGDPAAESNMLRWRVEGAMWLAAALTGEVPQGMFDVPMPAVTFGGYDAFHCAPISQIFANGNFAVDGSLVDNPGPTLPNEWATLSSNPGNRSPTAIHSSFRSWGPRVAEELPLDLRRAYAPSTVSVNDCTANNSYNAHVFGANASGPSDFTNLADFFKRHLNSDGLPAAALDIRALNAIGGALDGITCADPIGDFDHYPADASKGVFKGWLQGLVASLKTGQSTSSDMRAALYRDDRNQWYPWATVFGWDSGANAFSHYLLPDEPGPTKRDEFFNATATRYHWYNAEAIGSNENYTTRVWYPIPGDSMPSPNGEWFGLGAWWRDDRLTSHIDVSKRVRAAVNSASPNGDCGAMWQLVQALPLACVAARGVDDSLTWPSPPDAINGVEDLLKVEGYYRNVTKTARQMLGRVYLEKIPAIVVQNQFTQRVSSGDTQGEYGKSVYAIGNGMSDIVQKWNDVVERTAEITNAIEGVRIAVDQMNAQNEIDEKQSAIQHLNAEKDIIDQVARGVSSFGFGASVNPVGGTAQSVASAASIAIDAVVISDLDDIAGAQATAHSDQLKTAFNQLKAVLTKNSTDIQNLISQVQQDVGTVRSSELDMQGTANAVGYEVAKAAGFGVWNCGAPDKPKECDSHVNTVLNRRYAAYEQRYKAALRDAKALAFIARRAIEQRIGMPLSEITSRIGPLDAPATWADDVCRLTGVDYRRLRTEEGLDAGTAARNDSNAAAAAEFADGFIGDYVTKLQNFVEYYNIAYPAHEGDDTAVISLRQDTMRESGACQHPSANLLRNSAHLDFTVPSGAVVGGWQHHKCSASSTNCLLTLSSGASSLPADASTGGSTWLVSTPPASHSGSVESLNADAIDGPEGLVSQAVSLEPGHYLLTWWDRALDSQGTPTATPGNAYRVGVFDSTFNPVAAFSDAPTPSTSATWSARRTLSFDIALQGVYRVGFGASLSASLAGSVAIANVQLEHATTNGIASAYQDTDAGGQMTTYLCAASPQTLRNSFQRGCDPTGACYWELQRSLAIDTRSMTVNGYPLVGKVAAGNFNFRHIDFAVNLVGTGIRDCSGVPSPDCYGTGYLEYTLDHDGTGVSVLGYDSEARTFDFGIATIAHGKALAAERYITMPVGSSDQTLLQQPGILKPELRGRPLDGNYQIRIYDSPALRWDRLDDIQLVLKYRYWSRIATPGQF